MARALAWLGTILVAVGAFVASIAAGIYGPGGWAALRHATAFWIGVGILGLGVVLAALGLLPTATREVPQGHLAVLRGTFQRVRGDVESARTINFGGDRERAAFLRHYRRTGRAFVRDLRRYESVAKEIEATREGLRGHLRQRADELGVSGPDYDQKVIVGSIEASTWARAQAGSLSLPLTQNWSGYDSNGWVMPSGLSPPWLVVTRAGNESLDQWRQKVKGRTDQIDALGTEAQAWPEAAHLPLLWQRSLDLRANLSRFFERAKDRERFHHKYRCPVCRENR